MNEKNLDTYTLTVSTSNHAFEGNSGRLELVRVIEQAADRVRRADFESLGHSEGWRTNYPSIKDSNGNTVAQAVYTNSEEETAAQGVAKAMAVILLDPVTRATLEAVDPQAARQAKIAMGRYYGGTKEAFVETFEPSIPLREDIIERLRKAKTE